MAHVFATDSERHAHNSLRAAGFDVQPVQRTPGRTADFVVSDSGATYLLEVTDRHAGPFLSDLIAKARAEGVACGDRYIARNPNLTSKLSDKVHQLLSTPIVTDFRIVWLAVLHEDYMHIWRQLLRTLYGVANLSVWQGSELVGFRECLYYHPAAFATLRDLDAVVFAREQGGSLLINGLSPRADAFRRSRLCTFFTLDGRRDPSAATADTLIVDPELDRSESASAWRYLKDRYGFGTSEVVEAESRGCAVFGQDDLYENRRGQSPDGT